MCSSAQTYIPGTTRSVRPVHTLLVAAEDQETLTLSVTLTFYVRMFVCLNPYPCTGSFPASSAPSSRGWIPVRPPDSCRLPGPRAMSSGLRRVCSRSLQTHTSQALNTSALKGTSNQCNYCEWETLLNIVGGKNQGFIKKKNTWLTSICKSVRHGIVSIISVQKRLTWNWISCPELVNHTRKKRGFGSERRNLLSWSDAIPGGAGVEVLSCSLH